LEGFGFGTAIAPQAYGIQAFFGGCMRKFLIGSAIATLIVLSPRTEAMSPEAGMSIPVFGNHSERTPDSINNNEVGIASWYGEKFDGNTTANGEIFDMNELTVAHRSLPFGARVKVTNLQNKRSLVLRVNDRGPFIPGRILDVSKAAAKRLGFKVAGLAVVEIKVLSYPRGYHRSDAAPSTYFSGE
jgi:peptidoglycan lytic transglycosylase